MQDELTLLNRARTFDQDAMTQIHDRYYTAVYRYIAFRVQDIQTIEDLTSEVFVRFLSAIHDRHSPQNTIQGWLIGTAKNVVKEYYRKNRQDNWSLLEEETAVSDISPDEAVDKIMLNERLQEVMHELTEDQRQVLALRFGLAMPVKQVAEAMQKSEGAIKMLQVRAVASLTCLLRGMKVGK